MMITKDLTTIYFWDCECSENYIHPKTVRECLKCGAQVDEQPDSHICEVVKMLEEESE